MIVLRDSETAAYARFAHARLRVLGASCNQGVANWLGLQDGCIKQEHVHRRAYRLDFGIGLLEDAGIDDVVGDLA